MGLRVDDGRLSETAASSPLPDDGRVRGSSSVAIREALFSSLVASACAAGLFRLQFIGFVRTNLHALVAAVFLFLPQLLLRRRGDLDAYGLRARPLALGLVVAAVAVFGILPIFVVGFFVWNRFLCAHWPALVPGGSSASISRWSPPSERKSRSMFLMWTVRRAAMVSLSSVSTVLSLVALTPCRASRRT